MEWPEELSFLTRRPMFPVEDPAPMSRGRRVRQWGEPCLDVRRVEGRQTVCASV